jgi:hypothetical protein
MIDQGKWRIEGTTYIDYHDKYGHNNEKKMIDNSEWKGHINHVSGSDNDYYIDFFAKEHG